MTSVTPAGPAHWSEGLPWRDPVSGLPMELLVAARHPSGRPYIGALRLAGTRLGYPVVDGIPRVTPELACRYASWLSPFGCDPAGGKEARQAESSVDSFGFEWSWDNEPRTESDLSWRVATRFGLGAADYKDRFVLDAGCGAGDQSRWLLRTGGAARLLSADLSAAIAVAAGKLGADPAWCGIQADISALPLADGLFDRVYCEGVIQHTADSAATVAGLVRLAAPGGLIIATHYGAPVRLRARLQQGLRARLRRHLHRYSRDKVFFLCGLIAAGVYVPLLGRLWRKTVAAYNPLMPGFKATWSCTYDCYGDHAFQRFLNGADFRALFERVGAVAAREVPDGIVAHRLPAANAVAVG